MPLSVTKTIIVAVRPIVLLLVLALTTAAAPAPDVKTIVQRHIDAIGGAERWSQVDSLLIKGVTEYGTFLWRWKAPDRLRTDEVEERYGNGQTLVTAFDGSTAWISNPFQSATPRRMNDAERRRWAPGVAVRSDLLDLPKGADVTLLGEEKLGGRSAYKLSVKRPGEDPVTVWIDAQSYLVVQRARSVKAPWGELRTVTTPLSDYRLVDGVLVAHQLGKTPLRVEVNPELDDAAFRPPQPLR